MSAPAPVTVRAPAKINLFLAVGAAREDGYHPLNTVYQAISLYDDVRVRDADDWRVTVEPIGAVDCSGVPLTEDNLALRAGRLLASHHHLDRAATVQIHKGIPVAGGMAGGSADAAAALVALDRLWGLRTSDADLLALAAQLGSDVPFALLGGSVHGSGRGEVVHPVTDRGTYWWVVVPDAEGLSTPAVYAEFDKMYADLPAADPPDPVGVLSALMSGNATHLAQYLRNDLQEPALSLRPELRGRLRALSAAHEGGPVLLSGSGPTVLALAPHRDDANATRVRLLEQGFTDVHLATGPVAGAHQLEQA